MGHEWAAVIVAVIAATISVVAAIYSARQAKYAKRQADAAHGEIDPTFHVETGSKSEPPWSFRLTVSNFNRRPLRIKNIKVQLPETMIVWEDNDPVRDDHKLMSVIEAAAAPPATERSFEFDEVLTGIAPSAAEPTKHHIHFYVGFRSSVPHDRAKGPVAIDLIIEWLYASGDATKKTERMKVDLGAGPGPRSRGQLFFVGR